MAVYVICSGAAALYFLSRITGREVEILKSATRVYHLKDLEQLVQVGSEVFPLIVAVSGRVGSETPIKSEHSGLLSVLVQQTVQQHFLKRNWKFSWVRGSAMMRPITKQVPWHLDDGTGRVHVAGAQDAIGLALKFESEVFEKSEPASLLRGTLDFFRGFKMIGVRRIERVLPIGTQLTVVGEAIKDGIGDVRIQKPEGGPFYVSPVPLDQLISKMGKWSRRFKHAAIALTVVGVILISKPLIECILVRTACNLQSMRRQWLQRRDRDAIIRRYRDAAAADAAAAAADAAATMSMEAPTRGGLGRQHESSSGSSDGDGEVSDLCVICYAEERTTAFVECGHMCCCYLCSLNCLQSELCPICRKPIGQVLRIFRS